MGAERGSENLDGSDRWETLNRNTRHLNCWLMLLNVYLNTFCYCIPRPECSAWVPGSTHQPRPQPGADTGQRVWGHYCSLQWPGWAGRQRFKRRFAKISQSQRMPLLHTWAFSWLKVFTSAFTFKTLLGHYTKQFVIVKFSRTFV